MKWITREKIKVDRVACPWLIKKFVDSQSEFIFVPVDQVSAKARELGATPFDVDGCELGHHGELAVNWGWMLRRCAEGKWDCILQP